MVHHSCEIAKADSLLHLTNFHPLPGEVPPDLPDLRSETTAPKGGEVSDAVSALIVGLDMLIKRTKDRVLGMGSVPRHSTRHRKWALHETICPHTWSVPGDWHILAHFTNQLKVVDKMARLFGHLTTVGEPGHQTWKHKTYNIYINIPILAGCWYPIAFQDQQWLTGFCGVKSSCKTHSLNNGKQHLHGVFGFHFTQKRRHRPPNKRLDDGHLLNW